MSADALIVFLKNPESGSVKTRLANDIGSDSARIVYEKLIHYTLKQSEVSGSRVHLYFSGGIPGGHLIGENAETYNQKGNNLGEKMRNAFQEVFNRGYEKAIIIGSDCPEIRSGHIKEAFSMLDIADVVIGPATDGGYYLLGMKKLHDSLFENKNWSWETVLTETVKDFRKYKLNYAQLPSLTDIDTIDDYRRFPEFQIG